MGSAKVDAELFEQVVHELSQRVQNLETTVTKLEQRLECKTADDAHVLGESHDTEAALCLEERIQRIEAMLCNISPLASHNPQQQKAAEASFGKLSPDENVQVQLALCMAVFNDLVQA